MRMSESAQISIPKPFRDHFGMLRRVEVEIAPTRNGQRPNTR